LRQFNELITLRRRRVDAVEGGLHMVLTAFLAAFIGLVVFTVAGLDKPLSGPLAIDPGSYQLVLDRLMLLR
jgi:hypothetical protein